MAQNGELCKKLEQKQRKRQKSSSTCRSTFDNFQQNFHFRPESYAKLGAQHFCAQGLTLSDPSKWLKMPEIRTETKKTAIINLTCGLTFDSFQQICYCSTNFKAKFDAQHFSA